MLGDDSFDAVERGVYERFHSRNGLGKPEERAPPGGTRLADRTQIEFEGGQRLAEFVMKLSRQGGTLVVPHPLELLGKRPQRLAVGLGLRYSL